MSSESRVVRPYVGGEEFQEMLDGCTLRCADALVEGGGEVTVALDEYLNHPFELALDSIDQEKAKRGAGALDLDPSTIDLLVLMIAPRLRFVDTLLRARVDELDEVPDRFGLVGSERPRALRAPHGGADIRVYFCLNIDVEPRPVRPWRRGTWLAQQDFRVRSGLSGSGFVPIRMTDEDRERFGLAKDTTRFVTLDDGDPFEPDPSGDAVKLYVDGELLDRLAVSASTPVGKHVQRQLFLDASAAIVFAAQKGLRENPTLASHHVDDFRGSLVHKLIEFVADKGTGGESQDRREKEYRRLREEPTAFLAQIEAKTGIRKDILASFGEVR